MTFENGSITDDSGTISFGNNDLETAGCVTADIIGTVTGTVSDLSNHTTDDLGEGSTNLYFTDALAQAAVTQASLGEDHLITLSGVSEGSNDLGTFTGATILDNSTTKGALQALETEVETKLSAETITLATLKTEVAASADFADFKIRINALT